MRELGRLMPNRQEMLELRDNVWSQRSLFMFDTHVNDLIDFFHQVIDNYKTKLSAQEKTSGALASAEI